MKQICLLFSSVLCLHKLLTWSIRSYAVEPLPGSLTYQGPCLNSLYSKHTCKLFLTPESLHIPFVLLGTLLQIIIKKNVGKSLVINMGSSIFPFRSIRFSFNIFWSIITTCTILSALSYSLDSLASLIMRW